MQIYGAKEYRYIARFFQNLEFMLIVSRHLSELVAYLFPRVLDEEMHQLDSITIRLMSNSDLYSLSMIVICVCFTTYKYYYFNTRTSINSLNIK